jgi:hypothetical protein
MDDLKKGAREIFVFLFQKNSQNNHQAFTKPGEQNRDTLRA